jgi:hypothetical protein
VDFLGLAAPEWFFSSQSFYFIKNILSYLHSAFKIFVCTETHTLRLNYKSIIIFTRVSILRSHSDGVALASGRLQAVFPNPCLQRKFGFFSNIEERPNVLPWRPNRCNTELTQSSRHKRASRRFTRPFRREQGIRLLLSWKLHRIFLELWNYFPKACDINTCHNKALSIWEK